MTASKKSSWGRVAATLVASGCAAALAITILLPKSAESPIAVDSSGSMGRGDMQPNGWTSYPPNAKRAANGATEEFTHTGSRTSTTMGTDRNGDRKQAGGQTDHNTPAGTAIPFTNKGFTEGTVPPFPGIGFNPRQGQGQQPGSGPSTAVGSGNSNQASNYIAIPATATLSQVNGQANTKFRTESLPSAPTGGGAAISGPAPADPMSSAAPTGDRQSLQPGDIVDTRQIRPDETRLKRSELFKNEKLPGASAAEPGIPYTIMKPLASPLAPSSATPPAIKNPEQSSSLQMLVTPRIVIQEADSERLLDTKEQGEQQQFRTPREPEWRAQPSGEQYEQRVENIFQGVRAEPLSTFSIDVDTASYTNCRRFLNDGRLPPTAAVRVEEFINYFRYDYPQPTGKDPFSVNMEMAECPWTPNHKLLRVGLRAKEIDRRERPESNLVFLVDVSGSMSSEDKLPLLRDAMHRWVNELSANDRVTIVTYAGDAGLRLPTTRGDQKDKLHAAIETLQAGGSTHGSAGIKLAYEQATANFLEDGGVNRVLWATDGDLNVGTTGDDELVELITNKAKTGVFLTVLGVGTGNLKDAKLEKMADRGNGIYAYLDSPKEARKVLIEQMSGTTITIAKDVKIQIEFNPAEIAGYRLIGYENRILAAEDFANDKKDAGEIGAGHTVTALYEIIPVGAAEQGNGPAKEPLKYQAAEVTSGATATEVKLSDAAKSGELLTLKLRFKQPDGHTSELREFPLTERGGKFTAASRDFQFAGCVAQLAMILRDSQYRGTMTTAAIAEIAAATRGEDKDGSRAEFVELVKRVQQLGK